MLNIPNAIVSIPLLRLLVGFTPAERERERETERETERERGRERGREGETEREKETERAREGDREGDMQMLWLDYVCVCRNCLGTGNYRQLREEIPAFLFVFTQRVFRSRCNK